jgi:hypothetical protein
MYSAQNKISVKIGDRLTDPFIQEIGVRQGDVLSLTSLKKILNDFSKTLDEYDNDYHVCLSGKKISSLLYADDLVLFSSTPRGSAK